MKCELLDVTNHVVVQQTYLEKTAVLDSTATHSKSQQRTEALINHFTPSQVIDLPFLVCGTASSRQSGKYHYNM